MCSALEARMSSSEKEVEELKRANAGKKQNLHKKGNVVNVKIQRHHFV